MRDSINLLAISELPPTQRKIVRLLLRKPRMTYAELCAAIRALPRAERINRKELEQALQTLSQNSWVVRTEKNDSVLYRVNLRREESGREQGGRKNIWDLLNLGDETKTP